MARSTPPWKFLWNLVVWTRQKSHLLCQKIIWEDQERLWLPLRVSRPLGVKRKSKGQGMPLLMSAWSIFQRLSRSLKSCLIRVMCGKGPNIYPPTVTLSINIAWRVYDEIWCLQFTRWPCKNGNKWHATDSYITRLFFGRERIKRDHHGQKLITSLFYRKERIRKSYCKWKFYR